MKIEKHNYEEYMMEALEGTLSKEEHAALMDYLSTDIEALEAYNLLSGSLPIATPVEVDCGPLQSEIKERVRQLHRRSLSRRRVITLVASTLSAAALLLFGLLLMRPAESPAEILATTSVSLQADDSTHSQEDSAQTEVAASTDNRQTQAVGVAASEDPKNHRSPDDKTGAKLSQDGLIAETGESSIASGSAINRTSATASRGGSPGVSAKSVMQKANPSTALLTTSVSHAGKGHAIRQEILIKPAGSLERAVSESIHAFEHQDHKPLYKDETLVMPNLDMEYRAEATYRRDMAKESTGQRILKGLLSPVGQLLPITFTETNERRGVVIASLIRIEKEK